MVLNQECLSLLGFITIQILLISMQQKGKKMETDTSVADQQRATIAVALEQNLQPANGKTKRTPWEQQQNFHFLLCWSH